MPINQPQPMFVPQRNEPRRSAAEQMLITLASQAPSIGMQLYGILQQNQQRQAQENAGLQGMMLEAQSGNPDALRALAQAGTGAVSPIANPLEGGEDLPGVAPPQAGLDRLTGEGRRALAALFPQLGDIQRMRQARGVEDRQEAGELRDIEAHEAEMETRAAALIGQGHRNRLAAWESSDERLARRDEIETTELERLQFAAEHLDPANLRAANLAAEAQRIQIEQSGIEAGMQHWDQLTRDVNDLIRTYASGLEGAAVVDMIQNITNGLLQDRTPEDFGQIYGDYFQKVKNGTATAEDRYNLHQNLAGDTFITAAVRYGLQTEEAEQFRTELDNTDGKVLPVFNKRMQQIKNAKEAALLTNPEEVHPEIELSFEEREAEYRLLINLYLKLHDKPTINFNPTTMREDAVKLNSFWDNFRESGGPGALLNPLRVGVTGNTGVGTDLSNTAQLMTLSEIGGR